MKKIVLILLFITLILTSCEFRSESEKQKYYTPTASQIMQELFTERGTVWGLAFYEYYTIGNTNKHSKKGSGYRYYFSKNLQYEYKSWKNIYEYVWSPVIVSSYSGSVEVFDGKIIFHNLFGESRLEKKIQFSQNGEWIKIGDTAYKFNN